MSNPLQDFADSLPRTLPKTPQAPKGATPAPRPLGPVATEPLQASSGELAAASLQALLGEDCSDQDRYAAFRTLARACGRDLIVQWQTVFSHTITSGGLMSLFLVSVKALAFGKAASGSVYEQFTPKLLVLCGVIGLASLIAFRKKPDITLLIACVLAGVLAAIGLSAQL